MPDVGLQKMIQERSKNNIDSLTIDELRLEVEKGRRSIFQGDKFAYLKVRLAELEDNKETEVREPQNKSFFHRDWSDAEKWLMAILATIIGAAVIAGVGYGWTNLRVLRTVEFETMPNGFGLSAKVSGHADIKAKEIFVHIDSASFTLNHHIQREASAFRVVLAKAKQNKSWEIVGTSERYSLGFKLQKQGETKRINDIVLTIPISNSDLIAGHYLVFDIDDCDIGSRPCGTAHAHTRPDLF